MTDAGAPKKSFSTATRERTPTVLQMEAVECGAAALGMILGYHGRFVPLEELRVACGVSRDGSKASNLVRAARKYGLVAKGYRNEPESLRDLKMPVMVFWNFNHFVVLEGLRGGKAYLNDPASGPRVLTGEEFDECFTGVVLTFEPGPDFQPGGKKKSIVPFLRQRMEGVRTALAYAVVIALLLVIPGLVIPVFSKIFVDNVLVRQMAGWFKPLIIAMVITLILRTLLAYLQQSCLLRMETKLALTGSAKFLHHVFRLPMEFFVQRLSGDIASRVQLNDKVAQLVSGELAANFFSVLMIAFYAAVMCFYDPLLTAVGVVMAGANLALLKYIADKRKILNQRLQQETGKTNGIAMVGLQMIETLKATGSESDFYAQWSGQHAKVLNAQQDLALPNQFLLVAPPLLLQLTNIAILGLGGLRVMDGAMTIGTLVAFQSLMASFMQPVNQLVNLGGKLQEADADMRRLDDVMQYRVDPRFGGDARTAGAGKARLDGYLELRKVSFGYNPLEKPLITDFSLSLRPGSRVALVGGSGSGKSTVAKVVAGLYRPWEGAVLLDGADRRELPLPLIYNSVSMVDQDIFLFEGTVRDNLTMWDSSAPESDVIQAAKDACIHEDIVSRGGGGGYASKVDEGGANFSGGQRQRLEIARALVGSPRVLILDEATSALDARTEELVDDNLRRRGCTCLIVAHRISTIRDCDEIIVLDRGRVVERGTHDELIKMSGRYAELTRTM